MHLFLKLAILICLTGRSIFAQDAYIFFDQEKIDKIKQSIRKNEPKLEPYIAQLNRCSSEVFDRGPWSITEIPSPALSGDPHDYYSEGPYWWPDPDNPEAPFIRKDGLRNSDRFMAHKQALLEMYEAVYRLSLAGCLLDKPDYAQRAVKLIKVWFIDPKTKMNPQLPFAQAIPNKSPGRGVGIIDTHRFAKLTEAFSLLVNDGYLGDDDLIQLKDWFFLYTKWLMSSPNGIEEKNRKNNHASWWATQVAAFIAFYGDKRLRVEIWQHVREHLIESQIEKDGHFPQEQARTRSYDYTIFNLDALSLLATMAEKDTVNLWSYINSKGGSIKKSVDFMTPYLENPTRWEKEQIIPVRNREAIFLGLAALRFKESGYISLYHQQLLSTENPETSDPTDTFRLFLNLIITTETD